MFQPLLSVGHQPSNASNVFSGPSHIISPKNAIFLSLLKQKREESEGEEAFLLQTQLQTTIDMLKLALDRDIQHMYDGVCGDLGGVMASASAAGNGASSPSNAAWTSSPSLTVVPQSSTGDAVVSNANTTAAAASSTATSYNLSDGGILERYLKPNRQLLTDLLKASTTTAAVGGDTTMEGATFSAASSSTAKGGGGNATQTTNAAATVAEGPFALTHLAKRYVETVLMPTFDFRCDDLLQSTTLVYRRVAQNLKLEREQQEKELLSVKQSTDDNNDGSRSRNSFSHHHHPNNSPPAAHHRNSHSGSNGGRRRESDNSTSNASNGMLPPHSSSRGGGPVSRQATTTDGDDYDDENTDSMSLSRGHSGEYRGGHRTNGGPGSDSDKDDDDYNDDDDDTYVNHRESNMKNRRGKYHDQNQRHSSMLAKAQSEGDYSRGGGGSGRASFVNNSVSIRTPSSSVSRSNSVSRGLDDGGHPSKNRRNQNKSAQHHRKTSSDTGSKTALENKTHHFDDPYSFLSPTALGSNGLFGGGGDNRDRTASIGAKLHDLQLRASLRIQMHVASKKLSGMRAVNQDISARLEQQRVRRLAEAQQFTARIARWTRHLQSVHQKNLKLRSEIEKEVEESAAFCDYVHEATAPLRHFFIIAEQTRRAIDNSESAGNTAAVPSPTKNSAEIEKKQSAALPTADRVVTSTAGQRSISEEDGSYSGEGRPQKAVYVPMLSGTQRPADVENVSEEGDDVGAIAAESNDSLLRAFGGLDENAETAHANGNGGGAVLVPSSTEGAHSFPTADIFHVSASSTSEEVARIHSKRLSLLHPTGAGNNQTPASAAQSASTAGADPNGQAAAQTLPNHATPLPQTVVPPAESTRQPPDGTTATEANSSLRREAAPPVAITGVLDVFDDLLFKLHAARIEFGGIERAVRQLTKRVDRNGALQRDREEKEKKERRRQVDLLLGGGDGELGNANHDKSKYSDSFSTPKFGEGGAFQSRASLADHSSSAAPPPSNRLRLSTGRPSTRDNSIPLVTAHRAGDDVQPTVTSLLGPTLQNPFVPPPAQSQSLPSKNRSSSPKQATPSSPLSPAIAAAPPSPPAHFRHYQETLSQLQRESQKRHELLNHYALKAASASSPKNSASNKVITSTGDDTDKVSSTALPQQSKEVAAINPSTPSTLNTASSLLLQKVKVQDQLQQMTQKSLEEAHTRSKSLAKKAANTSKGKDDGKEDAASNSARSFWKTGPFAHLESEPDDSDGDDDDDDDKKSRSLASAAVPNLHELSFGGNAVLKDYAKDVLSKAAASSNSTTSKANGGKTYVDSDQKDHLTGALSSFAASTTTATASTTRDPSRAYKEKMAVLSRRAEAEQEEAVWQRRAMQTEAEIRSNAENSKAVKSSTMKNWNDNDGTESGEGKGDALEVGGESGVVRDDLRQQEQPPRATDPIPIAPRSRSNSENGSVLYGGSVAELQTADEDGAMILSRAFPTVDFSNSPYHHDKHGGGSKSEKSSATANGDRDGLKSMLEDIFAKDSPQRAVVEKLRKLRERRVLLTSKGSDPRVSAPSHAATHQEDPFLDDGPQRATDRTILESYALPRSNVEQQQQLPTNRDGKYSTASLTREYLASSSSAGRPLLSSAASRGGSAGQPLTNLDPRLLATQTSYPSVTLATRIGHVEEGVRPASLQQWRPPSSSDVGAANDGRQSGSNLSATVQAPQGQGYLYQNYDQPHQHTSIAGIRNARSPPRHGGGGHAANGDILNNHARPPIAANMGSWGSHATTYTRVGDTKEPADNFRSLNASHHDAVVFNELGLNRDSTLMTGSPQRYDYDASNRHRNVNSDRSNALGGLTPEQRRAAAVSAVVATARHRNHANDNHSEQHVPFSADGGGNTSARASPSRIAFADEVKRRMAQLREQTAATVAELRSGPLRY